jgi:hypothetical protein
VYLFLKIYIEKVQSTSFIKFFEGIFHENDGENTVNPRNEYYLQLALAGPYRRRVLLLSHAAFSLQFYTRVIEPDPLSINN